MFVFEGSCIENCNSIVEKLAKLWALEMLLRVNLSNHPSEYGVNYVIAYQVVFFLNGKLRLCGLHRLYNMLK